MNVRQQQIPLHRIDRYLLRVDSRETPMAHGIAECVLLEHDALPERPLRAMVPVAPQHEEIFR